MMENSDAFRRKFGQIITELANVGDFLMEHGFYERAVEVFFRLYRREIQPLKPVHTLTISAPATST